MDHTKHHLLRKFYNREFLMRLVRSFMSTEQHHPDQQVAESLGGDGSTSALPSATSSTASVSTGSIAGGDGYTSVLPSATSSTASVSTGSIAGGDGSTSVLPSATSSTVSVSTGSIAGGDGSTSVLPSATSSTASVSTGSIALRRSARLANKRLQNQLHDGLDNNNNKH